MRLREIFVSLAVIAIACGDPAEPPTATKLAFKSGTTNVIAGATLPDITVEVQDAAGNPFTSGSHEVSLELVNTSGATLIGTTTASTANGVSPSLD